MNFLPPLTNSARKIIFINIAVYLFFALDTFFLKVGLIEKVFILRSSIFQTHEYWQFFTYFFFHTDLLTLFFEMILIYFLAYPLEQNWGEKNFLLFYFICGVMSGVISVLFINLFGAISEQNVGGRVYLIYGGAAVGYSIITAFSLLYKERVIQLLLFFVLPISLKGKYILYIAIGFLLFSAGRDTYHVIIGLSGVVSGIIFLQFLISYVFGSGHNNSSFFFFQKIADFINRTNKNFQKGFEKKNNFQQKKEFNINKMSEENIEATIDELLEIISKKGFKNLSKEQRDFLLEASKKYKHKFPD